MIGVENPDGPFPLAHTQNHPAAMDSSKSREGNCFDFLRLFAATSVLIAHSAGHLNLPFLWLKPGYGTRSFWFYDGVPLFFILSGLLVYRSYLRCMERGRPLWDYILNRFLRVAPAIYAYAVVTAILILLAGAASLQGFGKVRFVAWFASNLVLYPISSEKLFPHFDGGSPNGSLWTIPVEFSFYLVVPLIYAVERRWGARCMQIVLAATVVLSALMMRGLASSSHSHASQLLASTCIPYLLFFSLGIFWSRTWTRAPQSAMLAAACALGYVSIRMLDVLHLAGPRPLYQESSAHPAYCLAWALLLSYLVLWVGHYGPRVFSQITRRIGDVSYGVYIWHMVVVNIVLYLGLSQKLAGVPAATQTLVVLGTFAVAGLSWWYIEKPALRWKPYSSRPMATVPAE